MASKAFLAENMTAMDVVLDFSEPRLWAKMTASFGLVVGAYKPEGEKSEYLLLSPCCQERPRPQRNGEPYICPRCGLSLGILAPDTLGVRLGEDPEPALSWLAPYFTPLDAALALQEWASLVLGHYDGWAPIMEARLAKAKQLQELLAVKLKAVDDAMAAGKG